MKVYTFNKTPRPFAATTCPSCGAACRSGDPRWTFTVTRERCTAVHDCDEGGSRARVAMDPRE